MAFACTCASCGLQFVMPLPVGSPSWICAGCQQNVPTAPANSGTDWGKVAMWGLLALGTYKYVVQQMLDEEYEGRTLPSGVRERLKVEHVAEHGSRCLHCGLRTSWGDLVIDHIYAYAQGGRTSIQNSQVMCRWCNGDKSDRVTLLDMLAGRGGRSW